MNNHNKLILAIVSTILLAGCGEHELCEKERSAITRMAIAVSKLDRNGTMYDVEKAGRLIEEAKDISQEVKARKIKCKD